MTNPILIEQRGPIEILSLNRPDKLNTMNEDMIFALQDYFRGLQKRLDVRVVLFRAEGRAFCAGLDIGAWKDDGSLGKVQHVWRTQRAIATVMQLMRQCPQPIIALGQGAACGGGFSLLLASDVRFGAPSLKMNAAYIKIGLGGCDMGSSYFLPRMVGSSIAAELILTGRFIHAKRAAQYGLISEVVEEKELLATGLALAEEMLDTAPMGLRLSKDALNRNIDAQSFEAALAIEDRQQVMLSMTDDSREAARAFFAKRKPDYKDR
ncbi:enoyl-CoA hydratase/isomerase family protein [Parasphingorhabdus halotolerans]|uniref:Enoyl-CoA hydratase/isomerase family protein n=1 Tax=Parasphingorhabdus halotolerans TaxID=2725558 RepID=A0A6H2DLN7_9SPHN|nr:enoyl-CoA hydratase-related protein [Parasphingorhabdus halotolerans]QJB69300.1 enoyl-CoA hydratase/isomerase family protein [Parasphingorhabdus halotolerans]